MVQLTDIHPMSGFIRDPKTHIQRLRETGRPEVLTVNGKASVVVQDAASYQKMLEAIDHLDAVRTLRARLASLKNGAPGGPAKQVFQELLDIIDADRA